MSKIWLCCDSLYHGESQANTYAIYIANLLYSHNRLSELWLYFVSRSERELCVLRPILLRFLIEKRNGRVWRACPMNVTDYSFKHESYLTKITIADLFLKPCSRKRRHNSEIHNHKIVQSIRGSSKVAWEKINID